MKITNIHRRAVNQPQAAIAELFKTLATDNDLILATDKWPPMKLDNNLQVGSKGGHGSIRYTVQEYQPAQSVTFRFSRPTGFNGIHKFEITALSHDVTELKHTISMRLSGSAAFLYPLAIRWLHDAYIEDAFDKVENHFTTIKKSSEWSIWVKLLRIIFKPKRK
jgi:hypothetical protein